MTLIVQTSLLLALVGQSPSTQTFDAVQAQRFLKLYIKEHAQYEIYLGEDTKLKSSMKPVFRFVFPQPGNMNGTLFVWTHEGRAEAIVSIWASVTVVPGKRKIVHEFDSLAARPIRAAFGGELVWHPAASGIDFKPVPDAPEPAATAHLRLSQIRTLARNFSVTLLRKGNWDNLRMLSQPIYRYKPESTNAPDGAVFAFLWEYDPSGFLIIEERGTPAGRRWHYGFAQSGTPISVRHKDTEVFSRDYTPSHRPQGPHYTDRSERRTTTDLFLSDQADDDNP